MRAKVSGSTSVLRLACSLRLLPPLLERLCRLTIRCSRRASCAAARFARSPLVGRAAELKTRYAATGRNQLQQREMASSWRS
jgi:hypothetical protein